jgi:outer membrane protein assembly factor BamB
MIFIAAYRLDSGKLAWVATVDGAHPSTNRGFDSLVGMGDKLVTGTMTHNPQHGEPALYVWSFESGKLLKKLDLEGRGLTGDLIRVDGSRVAAAYTDERNRGRVGVFDVEKGAFAWSAAMTINSWNGELRLAGERLVLSNNHGVEAFELESGKALWSNNLSRERRMVMDVTADPMGVFVLHGDQQTQLEQKIVRLDADTGKRAWTYSLPKSTGAFRLAQSQDYLVAPMMEGRPRENAQNVRMRLSHFQLEKTMLACIDKQAGTRSFVTDVGKLKDMRYVNIYRPPALVTVAEDAVYVTMQDSLYVYGGTR